MSSNDEFLLNLTNSYNKKNKNKISIKEELNKHLEALLLKNDEIVEYKEEFDELFIDYVDEALKKDDLYYKVKDELETYEITRFKA